MGTDALITVISFLFTVALSCLALAIIYVFFPRMTRNAKVWTGAIWDHQTRQRKGVPLQWVSYWHAIRATIALQLGLWLEELPEGTYTDDFPEVAWRSEGTYYTDYGNGHAFSVLLLVGFRVYEYSDGSI